MFEASVEAELPWSKERGRNPSEVLPRWGRTNVAENIAGSSSLKERFFAFGT